MPTGKRLDAVTDVSGTADATYSANEQTLITDLVTALNALLAELRDAGWMDRS